MPGVFELFVLAVVIASVFVISGNTGGSVAPVGSRESDFDPKSRN